MTPGRTRTRQSGASTPSICQSSPYNRWQSTMDGPILFDKAIQEKMVAALESINNSLSRLSQTHESLTDFNESVGSLMYGLDANAWCMNIDDKSKPKSQPSKVAKTKVKKQSIAKSTTRKLKVMAHSTPEATFELSRMDHSTMTELSTMDLSRSLRKQIKEDTQSTIDPQSNGSRVKQRQLKENRL